MISVSPSAALMQSFYAVNVSVSIAGSVPIPSKGSERFVYTPEIILTQIWEFHSLQTITKHLPPKPFTGIPIEIAFTFACPEIVEKYW